MTNQLQYPQLGRQPATSSTYAAKGQRIAQRLAEEGGSTDVAIVVALFITTGVARYTQRTFRLYKACLLQHLKEQGAPPSVIKQLSDASSRDCAKKGGAGTSGAKAKKVSADDRVTLLTALRASRSRSALLAADYFEAGLILGPRPVEWIDGHLEVIPRQRPIDAPAEATHLVRLANAKRDINGVRGNGDQRSIYASLTAEQAALVARVITDASSHTHDWAKHYNNLRSALRYAGKKLWPRRNKVPCFYTTRHQSQADAKASGMRSVEIAAIYGHASDNTSSLHYARKSQGDKNMCNVAPTALSLARVRNQRASERRELRTPGKNL